MNASEKFKFIWWGTAGCGSRSTSMCFSELGVDDLYNYLENVVNGETVHLHTLMDFLKVKKIGLWYVM